jgi:hypothetical protein
VDFETPKKRQWPLPTEGFHLARVSAVTDQGIKDYGYGPKPTDEFTFTILDQNGPAGEEITVKRRLTHSLHPKATLHAYVQAILGEVPKRFTEEHLLNRKVKLFISHSDPTDDGIIYARIDKVMKAEQK